MNIYQNSIKILEAILENSNGFILFSLDTNYCYTFFTKAHKDIMKAIWGVDIEYGKNMLDFIKNDADRAKAKANFDEALSGKSFVLTEEYGDEHLLRTFYNDYYSPVIIDNQIVGLSVFVIDITPLKQAELEIKRNREFYLSILENIPNPLFFKNNDNQFEFVNSSFKEFFNFNVNETPERLINQLNLNRIKPDQKEKIVYELTIYQNEKRKDIILHNTPLYYNEKFLGITGSITDISELKSIQHKLQENEKYLAHILQVLPVSILILNKNFDILFYNDTANNIINELKLYYKKEIKNLYDIKFIDTEKTIINFVDELKDKLQNGKDIENYNVGIFVKENIVWLSVNAIAMDNKILLAYNDITEVVLTRDLLEKNINKLQKQNSLINEKIEEQKRLLSELQKANNEKNKLFSIVAHDIKNPLSGIIGLSSILANDFDNLSQEKIYDFIKKINNSTNNLYQLLLNLMDWVNIKRENIELHKEKINLLYVIKEIKNNFDNLLYLKQINLNIQINQEYNVEVDKVMFNSIISNLISNAIKFSYRNSVIDIYAYEQGENIVITIKDFGIGIPDIMKDKLFDITEKTGRPGTEDEKSSGLGLIIVKEFVEKNEGRIWFESEENKGTTFYISFKKAY
ncbi:MAG TPA: ATP-binding protein [Ignavibacteriales bacterium]|nr:ATP-binding protein [Ignavibacteriales bacterium]